MRNVDQERHTSSTIIAEGLGQIPRLKSVKRDRGEIRLSVQETAEKNMTS